MTQKALALVSTPTSVRVAGGVVARSWRLEHFYGTKSHDPQLALIRLEHLT